MRRDLSKKICKRMKLPRHRTPGQLHGRLAGFGRYFVTCAPQTVPLMCPNITITLTEQVAVVPSGRVTVISPETVFVKERPVPVTVAVSEPSMITPAAVLHAFASTVSEPEVAHDRRPVGQVMLSVP